MHGKNYRAMASKVELKAEPYYMSISAQDPNLKDVGSAKITL